MNQMSVAGIRVRHQPRLRLLQVARVERISPAMQRVTLTGDALEGFTTAAPDDHVKLFFPAAGQTRPTLPVPGPDGLAYPEGAIPPVVRDYTPRRFDAERRELVIEFVLHGHGPASDWARRAAPGDWIGVGGPKGSFLAPAAANTLLIGDAAGLPAIARFLEEMQPGVGAVVLIEVADAREERYLPTAANAAITWLHRNGGDCGAPDLFEQALRRMDLPADTGFAWLAGEIEVVRTLRRYLIEEAGLFRHQIRAAGYWRLGAAGAHARIDD